MPQQQGIYKSFTGRRFLWYMASLKGIPKKEAKERIENVLNLVNLKDHADKKLGAYSGGMKQRILIAQALLNDPEVLLLDEPTAGLDPMERIRIRNFISEIAINKIVIITTHIVSDIQYISKEILLMNKGKLLLKDNPDTIVESMQGKVFEAKIQENQLNKVKEKYPKHCVDGEEEQFGKSKYLWVCDPVDGTAMYARHIPTAVFSLALVIDGVSTVGVIYDPFTDNLYSAIKDQGAYKNDTKMFVNNIEDLSDMRSVAHFDMWPEAEYNLFDSLKKLGKKTYFVSLGSIIRSSMCVANGEFTFALFPGTKHKNCDIAAVKVIVEEAGGKVTNLFGEEQRYDKDIQGAIISNGKVHDEVLNVLRETL